MRHCRKYSDFAKFFADEAYMSERMYSLYERADFKANGCVEITGYADSKGYAKISFGGTLWQAHRFVWLANHGDIGELVIDHKCRNPRCVNLEHLEPVTNAENVRRGKAHAHGGKCDKGHELKANHRGHLGCETCRMDGLRARRATDEEYRERIRTRNRENMRRYRAAKAA